MALSPNLISDDDGIFISDEEFDATEPVEGIICPHSDGLCDHLVIGPDGKIDFDGCMDDKGMQKCLVQEEPVETPAPVAKKSHKQAKATDTVIKEPGGLSRVICQV